MIVFELVDKGQRRRMGLFYTHDEADKYPGTQNRHLYDIREIDIPVIFVLEDTDWPEDGGQGVYAAYSTHESASKACRKDDQVVVWELHP